MFFWVLKIISVVLCVLVCAMRSCSLQNARHSAVVQAEKTFLGAGFGHEILDYYYVCSLARLLLIVTRSCARVRLHILSASRIKHRKTHKKNFSSESERVMHMYG